MLKAVRESRQWSPRGNHVASALEYKAQLAGVICLSATRSVMVLANRLCTLSEVNWKGAFQPPATWPPARSSDLYVGRTGCNFWLALDHSEAPNQSSPRKLTLLETV